MDWFDEAYRGTPPWDIGSPQPEFVRLAESGAIKSDVLDVGCGTGENALYLASIGHVVWGIDAAPHAIEKAKKKSEERGIPVTFLVRDALNLHTIGRKFRTVIDSGLFHALDDTDRPCFARNLAGVSNLAADTSCFASANSNRENTGRDVSHKPRSARHSGTGGEWSISGRHGLRTASKKKEPGHGCPR